jgi:hypothetical protein
MERESARQTSGNEERLTNYRYYTAESPRMVAALAILGSVSIWFLALLGCLCFWIHVNGWGKRGVPLAIYLPPVTFEPPFAATD